MLEPVSARERLAAGAVLGALALGVLGLAALSEAGRAPRRASAPRIEAVLPPIDLPAAPEAPPVEAAPQPDIAPPALPGSHAALLARARASDAAAQQELARRYAAGVGLARDPASAFFWYREAAINGSAEAQFQLARLYRSGEGVAADPVEALIWFHSAADRGSAAAQLELGRIYAAGDGVPADPGDAVRWWRKAAEQGHSAAQFALGEAVERGFGMKPSLVEAFAWYMRAAEGGSKPAAAARDRLAAALDPFEREAAAARAAAFAALPPTPPPPLVAELQRLLARAGYEPGPADGVLGERTAEAIRRYQREHALAADGQPGEALLLGLRRATGAPAPADEPAPAAARPRAGGRRR